MICKARAGPEWQCHRLQGSGEPAGVRCSDSSTGRGQRTHLRPGQRDYKKIGFDCSGLTPNAWAQVCISLRHYSHTSTRVSARSTARSCRAGDLVFWAHNTSDPTTVHHVATWMGNGQIVEARNSCTVVKVSSINWDGYIGAVRPGG